MAEKLDDLEIDCEMARFVGVDPLEHFLTDGVVDLVDDELHQCAVERDLARGVVLPSDL